MARRAAAASGRPRKQGGNRHGERVAGKCAKVLCCVSFLCATASIILPAAVVQFVVNPRIATFGQASDFTAELVLGHGGQVVLWNSTVTGYQPDRSTPRGSVDVATEPVSADVKAWMGGNGANGHLSSDETYTVWLWNVTNHDHVVDHGHEPQVKEVGPFTLVKTVVKENATLRRSGSRVPTAAVINYKATWQRVGKRASGVRVVVPHTANLQLESKLHKAGVRDVSTVVRASVAADAAATLREGFGGVVGDIALGTARRAARDAYKAARDAAVPGVLAAVSSRLQSSATRSVLVRAFAALRLSVVPAVRAATCVGAACVWFNRSQIMAGARG